MRCGEGVSEEFPASILDLLTDSSLSCQLGEGGVSHGGKAQEVNNLDLSLTFLREDLHFKWAGLGGWVGQGCVGHMTYSTNRKTVYALGREGGGREHLV